MADAPKPPPNCGFHFHGDYYRQDVTLENNESVNWPEEIEGARLFSISPPWAHEGEPSDADVEAGKTWPAWALISGDNGNVHGHNLGPQAWLWAEAPGVTWKVEPTTEWWASHGSTTVIFKLTRYGAFALGRPEETFEREREITINVPTTLPADYTLLNGNTREHSVNPMYLTDAHPVDGHQAIFMAVGTWHYTKYSAVKIDLAEGTASILYMQNSQAWDTYASFSKSGSIPQLDEVYVFYDSDDPQPWHDDVLVDSQTCKDPAWPDEDYYWEYWEHQIVSEVPKVLETGPGTGVGIVTSANPYTPFYSLVPAQQPEWPEKVDANPYFVCDTMQWSASFQASRLGVIGFTADGEIDYTEIHVSIDANCSPSANSHTTGNVATKWLTGVGTDKDPNCRYNDYVPLPITNITQYWENETTVSYSSRCWVTTARGETLTDVSASWSYNAKNTTEYSREYWDAPWTGGYNYETRFATRTVTGMQGGSDTEQDSSYTDDGRGNYTFPSNGLYKSRDWLYRFPSLKTSSAHYGWDDWRYVLINGDSCVPMRWEDPNMMRCGGSVIDPDSSGRGPFSGGVQWSARGGVEPGIYMQYDDNMTRHPITGEIKLNPYTYSYYLRTWV